VPSPTQAACAPAIEELESCSQLEGRQRFDALSARGRASFPLGDAQGAHRHGRRRVSSRSTSGTPNWRSSRSRSSARPRPWTGRSTRPWR
jgi:hypothetical protein